MKVLFLDVDGVLNSADWFKKMDPNSRDAACELDPKAVRRILHVLETTGAHLVLSSTWRLVPEYKDALRAAGLPIYWQTPMLVDVPRADEIRAWLEEHTDVDTYAIIDDDSDARIAGHFVKCHWKHGMYGKHERLLIAMLGEKSA